MKYEYKTSAAYRGYGWIEPLTDPEDSLIEDYVARRICDELNALQKERDALARENEAMRRCAIKYLGWLGVTHMPLDEALREDMSDPTMCGDAAIAKATQRTTYD
jgi:hypothetical protein